MNEADKKKFRSGKIILPTAAGIILTLILFIHALSAKDTDSIQTIRLVDDRPVYEMNYKADYYFNKYLKTGSKTSEEFGSFLNENIVSGKLKAVLEDRGCSSFFAKTPDGDYIFARNFDTRKSTPLILAAYPPDDFKSIGISNLDNFSLENDNSIEARALVSPYFTADGMNEYGVAVGVLTAYGSAAADDKGKVTLYDPSVMRLILDKARNVKEAVELLSQYNVKMESFTSHYMIADAEGNSVIIEFIKGKMQVIEKSEEFQIASNFLLYNNKRLSGFGRERYIAYDEALSETNGVISEGNALDLLEANTIPGQEQWSVIYNLTKKTMTVEFYDNYEKTYSYEIK